MLKARCGYGVLMSLSLVAGAAEEQTIASATANPAVLRADNSPASLEMAARPDAARYYWQYGQWWYYTPQNTWLRWNGAVWVQHAAAVATAGRPPEVRTSESIDGYREGYSAPAVTTPSYRALQSHGGL